MAFKIKNGKRVIAGAKKFTGSIKKSIEEYKAKAPERRKEALEKEKYRADLAEQRARRVGAEATIQKSTPKYSTPVQTSQPAMMSRPPAQLDFSGSMLGRFNEPPLEAGWNRDNFTIKTKKKKTNWKQKKKTKKEIKAKPINVDEFLRGQILG